MRLARRPPRPATPETIDPRKYDSDVGAYGLDT